MAAPMDLNIPFEDEKLLQEKLRMSFQLGYEVVAVNYFYQELLVPKKKKTGDKGMKTPEKLKPSEQQLQAIKQGSRKPFKVLSRISTMLDETSMQNSHLLNLDEIQKFDLIAVHPTSEKALSLACKDLNIDIITLDVTQKFVMKIKRQTISPALERGVYFEIQYSHGIRDATYRQYLIGNAQKFVFWCKGKNVILTSGCERPIELRGPYDVANLGILFNLNENQSKDAVMRNCEAVLKRSEGRRVYTKGTVKVESVKELSKMESWILEKSDTTIKPDTNNGVTNNNTHVSDSSDNDDSDNESNKSDNNEPKVKKIKLTT